MCGISGFIKKQSVGYISGATDAIRDIVYYNRLRGLDALGFFKVKTNGERDLHKDVGDPQDLIERSEFKSFINGVGDYRYLVQHNRHATKGEKKSQANAHPFLVKRPQKESVIIMVHNGTLHHIEDEDKWGGRTDSHILAKMLAADMPLEEIEAAVWGSFAIVWYDSEDGTLNFVRNDQRPMAFVECDNSIWFGSELYSVANAADRRSIKLQGFTRLPVLEHWKYHPLDAQWEKKKIQVKQKVYTGVANTDLWGDGWDAWEDYCNPEDKKEVSKSGNSTQSGASPPSSANGASHLPVVVPYHSQQTTINVSPKSGVRPDYSSVGGTKKKLKWGMVEDALGLSRGDFLLFSVVNHRATRRDNQVALEGRMVAIGDKLTTLHQLGWVEVSGMLNWTIGQMDMADHLWHGVITNIYQAHIKDRMYQYRFQVKDIEPSNSEEKDPFRKWNLLGNFNGTTVYNAETQHSRWTIQRETPAKKSKNCCPHMDKCGLAQKCLILEEQKQKEKAGFKVIGKSEFADSAHTLSLKCEDCGNFFLKSSLTRIQDGDGNLATTIRLCRECMEAATKDTSRMQRLFDNARLSIESVHKQWLDDGPVYDGERLPIVH